MCKIIIDSKVNELDTQNLEIRLRNLLEILRSQFKTVYVSIQLKCEVSNSDLNYRCEVEGVSQNSTRMLACSEHNNLMSALEISGERSWSVDERRSPTCSGSNSQRQSYSPCRVSTD